MRDQIADIIHKLQIYSVHLPESMAETFVDELENTIEEIMALFGWTKVSEKLPAETDRLYPVEYQDGTIGLEYFSEGHFIEDEYDHVVKWIHIPLPIQPPQEDEG